MLKTLAASVLALALMAPPALAEEPAAPNAPVDEGAVVADLLLARPLGLVAVAAGLVLYLPAALFQSLGGNPTEPVEDALIRRPMNFTFKRPVGHFPLD